MTDLLAWPLALARPVSALLFLLFASCGDDEGPEQVAYPQVSPRFADRTAAAGLDFQHSSGSRVKNHIVEAKGGGGAFLDYDGDGYLDIYLVNGSRMQGPGTPDATSRNALYRNGGDGQFTDVTDESGTGDTGWGMGCTAADYDNDGDVDIYVTNYGANVLYRNEGDGHFADVTDGAGVGLSGWSTGASFGDYDGDGDVDLYVAQYLDFNPEAVPPRGGMWKGVLVFAGPVGLEGAHDVLYRNEGNGRFTDVTRQAGTSSSTPAYGLGVVFGDYDGDGDVDLYVANDSVPNFLYQNRGDGTFVDVALIADVARGAEGEPQASMGIAYGDYDNNGFRDYLVTHFEDDYNTLYHNRGNGFFSVASFDVGLAVPGMPRLGFGTCFLDYDNDGDQDLVVANGHVYPQIKHIQPEGYAEPNQLFVNQGRDSAWRFVETPAGDLDIKNVSRGACKGDYDNDGDVDLLICNLDSAPILLRNEGGNRNHWLSVRLVGTESNRDGIGAKVRVVAADLDQTIEITAGGSFLSHSDTRAHFGLGDFPRADLVEVRWPSGRLQRLLDIPADQFLVIEESGNR